VLVVVDLVGGVPVPVVHEIHVAAVRDRDIAAALAMGVIVAGVFGMDSHDLLVSGRVSAVTQQPRQPRTGDLTTWPRPAY
jgi:hypothetical protein